MKLGDYTFRWLPDKFTIPRPGKMSASVKTYDGIAFFSWGTDIVGQEIVLEWEWMYADQWYALQELLEADEPVYWDLETPDRLFHGTVTNGPFEVGGVVTGGSSGSMGTITEVNERNDYIEVSGATGQFTQGETITDNDSPTKSAEVTGMEVMADYEVEVTDLDGKLFDVHGYDLVYRRDVKLKLLILGALFNGAIS